MRTIDLAPAIEQSVLGATMPTFALMPILGPDFSFDADNQLLVWHGQLPHLDRCQLLG
jgi:hypothetical protein